MSECCTNTELTGIPPCGEAADNGRFPVPGNLEKPRWKEAIARLLGPAMRLHRYRNLRNAMIYHALSGLDDRDCQ